MHLIEFSIRMIRRYLPDCSSFWKKRPLVFRTYFGEEYTGTPDEVIHQRYLESKKGTMWTFPEWWEYQTQLFKGFGINQFPNRDEKNASMKLLRIFTKKGILLKGPLSAKKQ